MTGKVRSAAFALALSLSASGARAATLEVVASATMVHPGGAVDVSVLVAGLGEMATPSLGAFDLVLTYDPAVFAFKGAAPGMELGLSPSGTVPGAADLTVFEVSLLTPSELNLQQPGSFTLFTASFDVVGDGVGVFDVVASPTLGDENGSPLPLLGVLPGTVTSDPPGIPMLSPWGLLLTALVLLFAALYRLRGGLA